MTSYKKRSQSLMDEISENLKRTIKKYNDLDNDHDLSVIQSENEESKSNAKDSEHKSEIIKLESTSPITKFENNLTHSNYNFDYSKSKKNSVMNNSNSNYPSFPMPNNTINVQNNTQSVNSHSNRIIKILDELNENINKDIKEIEDLIEYVVEKDLKIFFK